MKYKGPFLAILQDKSKFQTLMILEKACDIIRVAGKKECKASAYHKNTNVNIDIIDDAAFYFAEEVYFMGLKCLLFKEK